MLILDRSVNAINPYKTLNSSEQTALPYESSTYDYFYSITNRTRSLINECEPNFASILLDNSVFERSQWPIVYLTMLAMLITLILELFKSSKSPERKTGQ